MSECEVICGYNGPANSVKKPRTPSFLFLSKIKQTIEKTNDSYYVFDVVSYFVLSQQSYHFSL